MEKEKKGKSTQTGKKPKVGGGGGGSSTAAQASSAPAAGAEAEDGAGPEAREQARRRLREFKLAHRNLRKKWAVGDAFPDPHVIEAYQRPEVNHSEERFTWRYPNLDGVRRFMEEHLGWQREECDRTLLPLVAVIDQSGGLRQARLDSYYLSYHDNAKFASIASKRLKRAVGGLAAAATDRK